MILTTKVLSSLFQKRIIAKLNKNIIFCINVFSYENGLNYPVYVSNEKFKNCMDLLLITDENISKILTNLCVILFTMF